MNRLESNRASISPLLQAVAVCWLVSAAAVLQAQSNLPPGDVPQPTAFSRLNEAGDAKDHADTGHLTVYDLAVNRVKESGVTEVEDYKLYKLLTIDGCKDFSVLTWDYEPLSSFVRVDEVNIIRDGERIPIDLNGVRDLPAPQSMIYWGNRLKMLQMPRLHVGDGIEIRSYRKGFTYALLGDDPNETGNPVGRPPQDDEPPDENYIPPMPGEYFDIVLFESSVPVVEKRYVLELPKDKRLHAEVYNGNLYSSVRYSTDSTTYSWWSFDVPAHEHERYSPSSRDYMTKVVMSTAESWEAKSRWFFDVNERQFDVTDEIGAKVDEILEDGGVSRGDDREKAEVLLHWVAQNIRYSGQTMGQGEGFTLHSGRMIFEQRSGVCKDIAGMLVTMMRAAGLDSYAAMTMAGSRIEDLPADQFNHCVVALKKEDGRFEMYDPTWVPYYKDIWSKLETEQHYVIGTPAGESLARIPYSPPEESPLIVTGTAEIDVEGNLSGTLELRGDGAVDSRLRRMLSGTRKSHITEYLAGIMRHVGDGVESISYEHGELLNFERGMWWKISYRVPQYAMLVGDGMEFRSPMMQVVMHNRLLLRPGDYEWPQERNDDVFLYYTQLLQGEERIRLPKGYTGYTAVNVEEVDETYAYFMGRSSLEKRTLKVDHKLEIRRRQIPPDGYAGFRDAVNRAMDYAGTVFRVEKGGSR